MKDNNTNPEKSIAPDQKKERKAWETPQLIIEDTEHTEGGPFGFNTGGGDDLQYIT